MRGVCQVGNSITEKGATSLGIYSQWSSWCGMAGGVCEGVAYVCIGRGADRSGIADG